MNKPLVSIITPSFNQAKWLESCIQSVLNQTYTNIEYIIMDGGSTDGSADIIKRYESKLTYWQSEKDGGQAAAINAAFGKCKGQLIAYLNADDLLEPKAVEGIINAYEVNQDFSVYYGTCATIDEEGNVLKEATGSQIKFAELVKGSMLPDIFQPACFFNRKFLNRSYFVDTSYQFAFDYDLILFLSKQATTIFLNRHIASYRVHSNSKSSMFKIEAYKEKLQIQARYSSKEQMMLGWKRFKLMVAEKTGKFK